MLSLWGLIIGSKVAGNRLLSHAAESLSHPVPSRFDTSSELLRIVFPLPDCVTTAHVDPVMTSIGNQFRNCYWILFGVDACDDDLTTDSMPANIMGVQFSIGCHGRQSSIPAPMVRYLT
jgi:hypothetical protein